MSSQPNEKSGGVPDELVKELLRSRGLPLDAHVKVNVHTTRVRLNSDGTRTVTSDSGVTGGYGPSKRRRAPRWAAVLFCVVGFGQMTYGMWASHSDSLAAPLIRGSVSCRRTEVISQRDPDPGAVTLQAATTPPSLLSPCRIEQAVVVKRYTTTSRHVTHYHITTVTPTGNRDDISLAGRAGSQLWERVQPTERITVQRFVLHGYHLTGDVLAVGDGVSAALSQSHPDARYQMNLVNILIGGIMFMTAITLFVKSGRDA
jgi:hypothetical protein